MNQSQSLELLQRVKDTLKELTTNYQLGKIAHVSFIELSTSLMMAKESLTSLLNDRDSLDKEGIELLDECIVLCKKTIASCNEVMEVA